MSEVFKFNDKEFSTKDELFDYIIKNEKLIIQDKCSKIYNFSLSETKQNVDCIINEEIKTKADWIEDGFLYPVISTTRYRDSHKDVHLDGCFTKTVKEQQGKVNYCLDHELRYDSIIAFDKNVEMIVKNISWNLVNKSYKGETQALIFKIKEEDFKRKDVLKDIKEHKSEFQNSIRMRYITVKIGINSNRPEDKEYKKYYDKKINEIVNKEEVEEDGYFFGVEELSIVREGSLVVAGGSNDATSIIQESKSEEPEQSTQTEQKNEPIQITYFNAMLKGFKK